MNNNDSLHLLKEMLEKFKKEGTGRLFFEIGLYRDGKGSTGTYEVLAGMNNMTNKRGFVLKEDFTLDDLSDALGLSLCIFHRKVEHNDN